MNKIFSKSTLSKLTFRQFLVVLYIVLMTGMAELFSQRAMIFPEVSCLVIGLWLMDKRMWKIKDWQMPVIITLAAVLGVLISRISGLTLTVKMETAFLLTAALILVFRTSMVPTVSSSMLPVLLDIHTWVYPVTVFFLVTILAAGHLWKQRHLGADKEMMAMSQAAPPSLKQNINHWLVLALLLLPALLLADMAHAKLIAIPPLVVTMIEFSKPTFPMRAHAVTAWTLTAWAAILGTFSEGFLHQCIGLPSNVGALLTTIGMLAVYQYTKKYFLPAIAVALVPMIIPASAVSLYPLYVIPAAAYFIFVPKIVTDSFRGKFWLHRQVVAEKA
jgi:hypothetical protein